MKNRRTLLHAEVLVSRATIEVAVQELALTCARGPRQLATVREWIEYGTLHWTVEPIPGRYPGTGAYYGTARLPYQSWRNLIKRMRQAGFVVTRENHHVSLYWKGVR